MSVSQMADLENNSALINSQEDQHTPGPWHITRGLYGNPDGMTIWGPKGLNGAPGTPKVCDVDGIYNREADARLIAAAPDLLAALEAIHKGLTDGSIKWTNKRRSEHDPYHPANTLMCIALDKVRGSAE